MASIALVHAVNFAARMLSDGRRRLAFPPPCFSSHSSFTGR